MAEPGAPDAARIADAAAVLRSGGLVAFPTETVYGLGADASSPLAVSRVFAVKGRPTSHPVIVHLAGTGELERWARPRGDRLARLEPLWPGPLTVVVPRAAGVCDEVTGGRDTVGLRVPDHPVALALLDAFGGGVAAPSANRFGRVSPTTAQHVRDELGDLVDLVLDGGPCRVGVESTILDLSGEVAVVRRRGGISSERLAEVLGEPVEEWDGSVAPDQSVAPGTLASHYAPRALVRLADDVPAAVDAAQRSAATGRRVGLLAAGPVGPVDGSVEVLDPAGAAAGYAQVLYDRLREADRRHLDVLWVVPPTGGGIAAAVRDRLRRAAYDG